MRTKPTLIGITGNARHGKGSIANILAANGYTVLSFAEPVREFLLKVNPLIQTMQTSLPGEAPYCRGIRLSVLLAQYGWDGVKERFPDVRALLQRVGTDAAKPIFGNDCWVNIGLYRAKSLINQGARICFDDVRFPLEEGEAILDLNTRFPSTFGAEIWRVTRPGFDNGIGLDHPSEAQVKNFVPDEEIVNDGTLDDLRAKVEALLK